MEFKWQNYNWRVGQLWGNYHPNFLLSWYSPDAVAQSIEDNILKLNIINKAKIINIKTENNGLKIIPYGVIPYGVGLVSCTEEFGYGTFEWNAQLPKGKNIVAALWLASNQCWPPEIDCVEAFTNSRGSYNRCLFQRKIQPNIHYSDDNKIHQQKGAVNTCRFLFDINKAIDYKINFFPDIIEVFYNGKSVMKETRDCILKDFKDIKMFPIMNINVMEGFRKKDLDSVTTFNINSFNYIPYR